MGLCPPMSTLDLRFGMAYKFKQSALRTLRSFEGMNVADNLALVITAAAVAFVAFMATSP